MKTTRYGIDDKPIFVIDPSRCIGCEACVQACAECGTHRSPGHPNVRAFRGGGQPFPHDL